MNPPVTLAIIIIVVLVVLCWIGSVVAYIFENRADEPSKSFQIREEHIFTALEWTPWWLSLFVSAIAVLLIAPIYIIEWLVRTKTKKQ